MDLEKNILELLRINDADQLNSLIEENHKIDIAIAIEEFSDEDISIFTIIVQTNLMAEIIEESEEDMQIKLIAAIPSNKVIEIFSHMSKDNIADILGILPVNLRKHYLSSMKSSDSKEIQMLLSYGEETAGGIMTTQYISLKNTLNIKETWNKIKSIAPKTEVIETIFIVDEKEHLVGTADLRDILIADENSSIMDIVDENIISIEPETDQEEVSLLVSKYDLNVIPVVNKKNVIIGIITVDDIIDVIVEEQTEDLLHLSGISPEETFDNTLKNSVKQRLPWLFVNLFTAFLASFTVGLFEDTIAQVVALAAAMPIVAGMGGNAGSQTLSLVIRGIALGEIEIKKDWKLVFREVLLGLVDGFFVGIMAGIILSIRY
ncbi:MAG: magnesium transporter, partial [Anaerocolumna sp.]